MRNIYVASLLLALAAPALGAEPPRGQLIPRVATRHDPAQTFALYLPRAYDADRKWPVLYGFSPGGNGRGAIQRFVRAAEKHGWILIGSNNSRNGPDGPIDAAMRALARDADRFAVDPARRYATGMSGGARVALEFALREGPGAPFAGLISCAAAESRGLAPAKGSRFVALGLVGTKDYNLLELMRHHEQMRRLGLRQRLTVFEGGHGWPPARLAEDALTLAELIARCDAGDHAEATRLIRAELTDARALLRAKDRFYAGLERLELLASLTEDVDSAQARTVASALAKAREHERYAAEHAAMEALRAVGPVRSDQPTEIDRVGAAWKELISDHPGTTAAARARLGLTAIVMRCKIVLQYLGNRPQLKPRFEQLIEKYR